MSTLGNIVDRDDDLRCILAFCPAGCRKQEHFCAKPGNRDFDFVIFDDRCAGLDQSNKGIERRSAQAVLHHRGQRVSGRLRIRHLEATMERSISEHDN
jgi:hypothetical protein